MARYVAFLRGINVGGHVVRMETLKEVFSQLGFSGVETFIASGNVIFESKSGTPKSLEQRIEKRLESKLGYSVATFLRTFEEVRAISEYKSFSDKDLSRSQTLVVGFLKDPLPPSSVNALEALKAATDALHVHGRELYWLLHGKLSESTLSYKSFERIIKGLATFRNANTITRLAAKYPLSLVAKRAGTL